MKERLKSLLLAVLVLSSLYLTYLLWYGPDKFEEISEDVYERVYFEEPRPQVEVVTPRHLILRLSGGETFYLLREGDYWFTVFWNSISGILQEYHFPEDERRQLPAGAESIMVITFRPALPAGQGSQWLKGFSGSKITEIGFWMDDHNMWISLEDSARPDFEAAFLLSDHFTALIEELLLEFIPEEKHLYSIIEPGVFDLPGGQVIVDAPLLVPAGKPEMDDLPLREEPHDPEKLLRTFFVNPSMVRMIATNDSLIFTDGEKALRLGSRIEYSHPQLAQDPVTIPYTGALGGASKLLCYYGGWPENLRLESLELQEQTLLEDCYHARWSYYHQGYRLYGDVGVSMLFNDRGLVEYRRGLYEPLFFGSENRFVAPGYRDSVQAVLEQLFGENNFGSVVLEYAGLGYLVCEPLSGPVGVPVWVIRLDGTDYYLCARSLSLLEGCIP